MSVKRFIAFGTAGLALLAGPVFWNAVEAQEPKRSGAIEGNVIFKIDVPQPERIKVTRNADVCGAHQVSEELIVSDENRGLKNVAVLLLGLEGTSPPKSAAIGLDQKGCAYHPHVQITTAGASLTIENSDPTFHNVHAYHLENEFKKPTLFNMAQPAGSPAARQTVVLEKTGVVEFNCDVHPWMKAYIVVHENAYFALTDEKGHYAISGIPPGEYTLRIWHEALGELDQPVTIEAGKTLALDFPIEENE